MILSKAQAQQYYRIFNSLLVFLVDWSKGQGMLDSLIEPNHVFVEGELESVLLDAVFGEGGRREAIDAYVDACRGELSQQDIDVALGWKCAVAGEYDVVRSGEDVLFVDGDDVYAVCGITHELDDRFLDLPGRVFTYLVPLHEHITYLTELAQLGRRLPESAEKELLARVAEAGRDGRVMRTGAELIQGTRAGSAGGRFSLTRRIDGPSIPERVEPLAGLTWDQRQAEIERHGEQLADPDALFDVLHRDCLPGEPTRAYREMISRVSTSLLRSFAENHEVYDELTREGYVDLLADIFEPRLPKLTDDLRKLGIRFMREMRALCEQGGEMRFSKDEAIRFEDIPRRIFPHVSYFDDGGDFVVVLSDEARSICEDVDWEVELARAERLEEALAFLVVATNHRGLIAQREAMRELSRRFADVDPTDIEDAVERRSNNYLIRLVPMRFAGDDYFVDEDLFMDEGEPYSDIMYDILSGRRVRRAIWPTPEQVAQGVLFGAWQSYDEGRRLAAFFEEHVPDGYDGYRYSSSAVSTLVFAIQHLWDARLWLQEGLRFFAHSDAEETELRPMLQDLYNALPNRFHNGATPRQAWGRDTAPGAATPAPATPRKPKKKRPTKKRRR